VVVFEAPAAENGDRSRPFETRGMMNSVTLSNNGLLLADGKTVDSRPLMFLNAQVQLAADCTLRSYFRMIEQYPIFSEFNPFFSTCMETYRSCPASGCHDRSLDYLILTKTIEMIGFPGKPRLEIYHSLYGVQDHDLSEIRLFTLELLLDVPLKLGKLKHVIFGDKTDMFEFDTVFTLFELIDAIVWELSFHGSLLACDIRR
jgi:hypothetical protein